MARIRGRPDHLNQGTYRRTQTNSVDASCCDKLSRRLNTTPIHPMRFFAYIFGTLILIGGLAWGAIELGAPQLWVTIGALIFLGLGIITGASRTRIHRPSGDVTVVRADDEI